MFLLVVGILLTCAWILNVLWGVGFITFFIIKLFRGLIKIICEAWYLNYNKKDGKYKDFWKKKNNKIKPKD